MDMNHLAASNRLPWSIALLRASRRASSTNCSFPKHGEISYQVHEPSPLAVRSGRFRFAPTCAHPGVHRGNGFAEHRLQRFEATNPNHFRHLLSGLTVRPLVRAAGTSRPDFAREENQRRPDQAGAAQQPKTIEKAKERRLLLKIRASCALACRAASGAENRAPQNTATRLASVS